MACLLFRNDFFIRCIEFTSKMLMGQICFFFLRFLYSCSSLISAVISDLHYPKRKIRPHGFSPSHSKFCRARLCPSCSLCHQKLSTNLHVLANWNVKTLILPIIRKKYNPPLISGKFLGWCQPLQLHQNQWSSLMDSFLYSTASWLCWLLKSNSRRRKGI